MSKSGNGCPKSANDPRFQGAWGVQHLRNFRPATGDPPVDRPLSHHSGGLPSFCAIDLWTCPYIRL